MTEVHTIVYCEAVTSHKKHKKKPRMMFHKNSFLTKLSQIHRCCFVIQH
ncbi:Uncharacterised protein [Salmonella enterica]|nr:Uncharacterised protein [Salmonella enterica]